jgi:hypothetical protein
MLSMQLYGTDAYFYPTDCKEEGFANMCLYIYMFIYIYIRDNYNL